VSIESSLLPRKPAHRCQRDPLLLKDRAAESRCWTARSRPTEAKSLHCRMARFVQTSGIALLSAGWAVVRRCTGAMAAAHGHVAWHSEGHPVSPGGGG
jgi:hypothetical protein